MRSVGFLVLSLLVALPGAARAEERVWLALEEPADGLRLAGPLGLVELRGRAGVGTRAPHDVVVALDLSGSTLFASGVDVDGDGKLGTMSRWVKRAIARGVPPPFGVGPKHLSSDTDDSVRAAEIAAADRLFRLLDFDSTRVGLVVFHGIARVSAPLGTPREELLELLEVIREESWSVSGATDFEAAIDTSVQALVTADPAGERRRSVLFLSDGAPTVPRPPERARQKARQAADRARAERVRIFAYALGPDAIEHEGVYTHIAHLTAGRMVKVDQPGDILVLLSQIDLAGIADVRIENVTAGREGRAVRTLRDGSFDGFLDLAPGPNRLRVTATGSTGAEVTSERTVFWERRHAFDEHEEELARLTLERLKARTAEIQLLREMTEARMGLEVRGKEVELEVEED